MEVDTSSLRVMEIEEGDEGECILVLGNEGKEDMCYITSGCDEDFREEIISISDNEVCRGCQTDSHWSVSASFLVNIPVLFCAQPFPGDAATQCNIPYVVDASVGTEDLVNQQELQSTLNGKEITTVTEVNDNFQISCKDSEYRVAKEECVRRRGRPRGSSKRGGHRMRSGYIPKNIYQQETKTSSENVKVSIESNTHSHRKRRRTKKLDTEFEYDLGNSEDEIYIKLEVGDEDEWKGGSDGPSNDEGEEDEDSHYVNDVRRGSEEEGEEGAIQEWRTKSVKDSVSSLLTAVKDVAQLPDIKRDDINEDMDYQSLIDSVVWKEDLQSDNDEELDGSGGHLSCEETDLIDAKQIQTVGVDDLIPKGEKLADRLKRYIEKSRLKYSKEKIVKSDGKVVFKCLKCEKEFDKRLQLTEHRKMHSRKSRLHECSLCGKVFQEARKYFSHMSLHERMFECKTCSRKFSLLANLKKHIATHKDAPEKLCVVCGSQFTSEKDLNLHYEAQHSEDNIRTYSAKCDHCGKEYMREEAFMQHLSKSPYVCTTCKNSFGCEYELKKHVKHEHGRCVCEFCGRSFKTNSILNHIKVMHKEAHVQCPHCPKKFVYRSRLLGHIDSCHNSEKKYKCNQCPYSAKTANSINFHRRKCHMDPKRLPRYGCDICNRKFYLPSKLTLHYRAHTGEKPFACHTCGKSFACKYNMLEHERAVHGERVEMKNTDGNTVVRVVKHRRAPRASGRRCDLCGINFPSSTTIIDHMKKVHASQPAESADEADVKVSLKFEPQVEEVDPEGDKCLEYEVIDSAGDVILSASSSMVNIRADEIPENATLVEIEGVEYQVVRQ